MPKKPSTKTDVVARNANSLFKPPKNELKGQHCVQNVNVQITMPKEESAVAGCFKALLGCFRKGG